MRTAEGPAPAEPAVQQAAADALDHADLERLGRVERRQDARQARGQHRLARAGRADHQEIVRPGGGDLEGALRGLLALHLAEVGHDAASSSSSRGVGGSRSRRPRAWSTSAMRVGGGQDRHLAREPGRLGAAGLGADEAHLALGRGDRRRQHARHRLDAAVQRQLAQREAPLGEVGRQHAHDHQEGERDRQVVVAALLGEVGRRQVHGDPPRRQGEAHGGERRPHPLAALGHGLVGQAHDGEGGQARAHLDLDVDLGDLEPDERDASGARDRQRCRLAPLVAHPVAALRWTAATLRTNG